MLHSLRHGGPIGRGYRHIGRYRDILKVIIKYGFSDIFESHRVGLYFRHIFARTVVGRADVVRKTTLPEKIRMALEELGPTFVKMGQLFSSRADMIPPRFLVELQRLQDDVPPFPYEDVRRIVREDLGGWPEEMFHSFDTVPMAAASLGQVHHAVLGDGTDVAVKVQRPNIRRDMEIDFEILLHLVRLNEHQLQDMGIIHPTGVVDAFIRRIQREMDYTVEAANIERFAWLFRDDKTIRIPKVYRELSTRRVLVMEHMKGIKASNTDELKAGGYDLGLIARRGADAVLKQIFEFGFFHADPHPGNVIILPDNVICYLDFGAMGRVSRRERDELTDLVMNVVHQNDERVIDSLLAITIHTREPNRVELEHDVSDFFSDIMGRPLKDINLGKVLEAIMTIFRRHGLSLKPHHFIMVTALGHAEALGRKLDPDFDILQHAEPFVTRNRLRRIDLQQAADDLFTAGTDMISLVGELPGDLRTILRQAQDGTFTVEFHHRGLEPMITTFDKISVRLTYAIVLAALIIGSSLMVLSNVPPLWHEIPVVGIVGFLISGVMGFWLLLSIILQRGRL